MVHIRFILTFVKKEISISTLERAIEITTKAHNGQNEKTGIIMSKKTVISDFTALKGKITFSEADHMQPTDKGKQSAKETQKQHPTKTLKFEYQII